MTELRRRIIDLRAVLMAEIPQRLHTESTPRLLDDDGVTDRHDADERGIGLPLTATMHRFIGHWSHWGSSRLGMLSIMEVSEWCHGRHVNHQLPGNTRSLCAQILYEVGYLGQEPSDVAWLRNLSQHDAESMLLAALRHAAHWRTGEETRSRGARFDGPDPLPYEPLRRRGLRTAS